MRAFRQFTDASVSHKQKKKKKKLAFFMIRSAFKRNYLRPKCTLKIFEEQNQFNSCQIRKKELVI